MSQTALNCQQIFVSEKKNIFLLLIIEWNLYKLQHSQYELIYKLKHF